jgi:MoaA/NifB/PqqE/SkfB family radical SAM enzyme
MSVRIVNWLLTRRCNLKCDYCGIVRDTNCKEWKGLPSISYYKDNEITADRVITLLNKFRTYNPDIFHIFYGGEPFLRGDLGYIIRYCNRSDIDYTIISNCTNDVRGKILRVMDEVGGFKGITGSIDPVVLQEPDNSQIQLKSAAALKFLTGIVMYVKDVVAEVTMTKDTVKQTYDLIKMLSDVGIYTSLSAIDISKNDMYDFSAIKDKNQLVEQTIELKELFYKLMLDESLLIHMKHQILPTLFNYIDSSYNCEVEKTLHNLTIDADGSVRTCLRIKGVHTPTAINDRNLFNRTHGFSEDTFSLNPYLFKSIADDRENFCKGCNHTCMMMSKYVEDHENEANKIIDH